jgi:hypothetical protein
VKSLILQAFLPCFQTPKNTVNHADRLDLYFSVVVKLKLRFTQSLTRTLCVRRGLADQSILIYCVVVGIIVWDFMGFAVVPGVGLVDQKQMRKGVRRRYAAAALSVREGGGSSCCEAAEVELAASGCCGGPGASEALGEVPLASAFVRARKPLW